MTLTKKIGGYDVNYFVDPEKAELDAEIDPLKLDEAAASIAQLIVYYSNALCGATAQLGTVKMSEKAIEATRADEIRKRMIDEGEKIVEKRIESELDRDRKVMGIRKAVAECQAIERLMWGLVDAMKAKQKSIEVMSRMNNHDAYSRLGQREDAMRERMSSGNAA
jgi:hypothetical protein